MDAVATWLSTLKLSIDYSSKFREECIDGDVLIHLTDENVWRKMFENRDDLNKFIFAKMSLVNSNVFNINNNKKNGYYI